MLSVRWSFAGLFLYCSVLFQPSLADDRPPLFETDIRPLFAKKCGHCHSDQTRKGDLNLSTVSDLRRGGESGESLISGTLQESLLWTMVDGGNMPPDGQPPLTLDERILIRKWIEGGAKSSAPDRPENDGIHQHDVIPIVLLRCAPCHGARLQEGGLDLRTVTGMKRGGKSGSVIAPGIPANSLMIRRVVSEACPPRELLLKFFVKRPEQPTSQFTGVVINETIVAWSNPAICMYCSNSCPFRLWRNLRSSAQPLVRDSTVPRNQRHKAG
jgi:hypothetical protein